VVIYGSLPDHGRMHKKKQLVLLGKKIRELRQKAGFSQEAFATDAGLERSYYGRVERGERNPTAINIIKIADALDQEVGKLFPRLEELRRAKR